jgi:outer membrane receptor for ferrienterochelin and colicins
LAALVALANAGTASAEVSPEPAQKSELSAPHERSGEAEDDVAEPVVVTGTRTAKPWKDAPVATEVVDQATVRASGAETLTDLLEEQPGLQIRRSFGAAGVELQGLDPAYTLVLIDGQRAGGRVGGIVDLNRFQATDLEQVEIVRGSTSALYGSEAIGGVVNLITRRPSGPLSAQARLGAGTLDTWDATASVSGGVGKWGGRASVGYHRFGGYDLDPRDTSTNGAGFDQINASLRTDYGDSDTSVTVSGDYTYRDQFAVDAMDTGAVFDRLNRTEILNVRVEPRLLRGIVEARAWAGYSLFRDQFLLDQRGAVALDQAQLTVEHLAQAGAQVDITLHADHLLTVGLEGLYEQLRTARLRDGVGDRGRVAPFVQHEWTLPTDLPTVLTGGVRADVDTQFGAAVSPRLGARLDPTEWLALRLGAGLGFRAPTFRELLLTFQNPGAGYTIDGNPDLEPERSASVNASAEFTPTRWLWLSANAYYTHIRDLIAIDTPSSEEPGPDRFRYINVDAASTLGVDSWVRFGPLGRLQVDLGYSFVRARDLEADRALEGRPTHRGTLGLRYGERGDAVSPWSTEASARAAINGPRPFYEDTDGDGQDEARNASPYATVDLRFAQSLGAHMRLFVMGENLLNAGHPTDLAIQPRTFTAGIEGRL